MTMISLRRLSWSLWCDGGKEKEPLPIIGSVLLNSSSSSSPETELCLAPLKETKMRVKSDSDDGGDWCLCGSESDDDDDDGSDWSIGWLEPLASDFQSDHDDDDGDFAVLVPCYTQYCFKEIMEGSNNVLFSAIENLSNEFSSARNSYMEQWLASLQKFEA